MGDPGCQSVTATSELSNNECNDGVDNDGDGRTDFRADMLGDMGCTDSLDGSERGSTACDNGADDDGDGRTDYNINPSLSDPVAGPTDNDERGTLACDNAWTTTATAAATSSRTARDPGCTSPSDAGEREAGLPCDNGTDDDNDGGSTSTSIRC